MFAPLIKRHGNAAAIISPFWDHSVTGSSPRWTDTSGYTASLSAFLSNIIIIAPTAAFLVDRFKSSISFSTADLEIIATP
jgi:hypothetical protein